MGDLYLAKLEDRGRQPRVHLGQGLEQAHKIRLAPGETREVSLTIGRDALSFYDDRTRQWTAEPGRFEALIGNASDHITTKVGFRLK